MALADYMTTQDVADLLEVTDGRVRQLVMEGRLRPLQQKFGPALIFEREYIEKFAAERHRHPGPLQLRCRKGEQAIVRKGHEAAAMDVAHAVEVLPLDPERTTHAAVVLHPVPELPVMGFELVTAPGAPAGEFALGFDMEIGAVEECGFGQVVQRKRPFNCGI